MNALAIERTPAIVATEINSIKEQTRRIVLCNSIEIGRRLVEAKTMLDHGEWGKWLKESVDYSQSTANNLMRIFDEYGASQQGLFGSNAKSQTLGDLTYSQAVALLGIPNEEREDFVKENAVENMSTRELQKAIKERDQAVKAKETAEKSAEKSKAEHEKLQKKIADMEELQKKLEADKEQAQSDASDFEEALKQAKSQGAGDERIKELEAHLKAAQEEAKRLTAELDKPVTIESAIIEKAPDISTLRYRAQFDVLKKCFGELLVVIGEIPEVDREKILPQRKNCLRRWKISYEGTELNGSSNKRNS